jgi:hypothetical protein
VHHEVIILLTHLSGCSGSMQPTGLIEGPLGNVIGYVMDAMTGDLKQLLAR